MPQTARAPLDKEPRLHRHQQIMLTILDLSCDPARGRFSGSMRYGKNCAPEAELLSSAKAATVISLRNGTHTAHNL